LRRDRDGLKGGSGPGCCPPHFDARRCTCRFRCLRINGRMHGSPVGGLEAHVHIASGCDPAPGEGDGIGRALDTQHAAVRPNQTAEQHGNVARAAADLQHVHAGRQPGAAQEVLRFVLDERGLPRQPPQFAFRLAKQVLLGNRHVHAPYRSTDIAVVGRIASRDAFGDAP
jgi:hypothetical protein